MWVVQKEFLQAAVFVTATNSPDGGSIAFQSCSDRLDRFATGDGQHDPGVLHLEPSQAAVVSQGS
jgi:hypothetical protein